MRRLNNGKSQTRIESEKYNLLLQASLWRDQPAEIFPTTATGAHQTTQEGDHKIGEA